MRQVIVVVFGALVVGAGCRAESIERECDCRPPAIVATAPSPAVASLDEPPDERFLAAYAASRQLTLGVPVPMKIELNGAVVFRRTEAADRGRVRWPRFDVLRFRLDADGTTRALGRGGCTPENYPNQGDLLLETSHAIGGWISTSDYSLPGSPRTCSVGHRWRGLQGGPFSASYADGFGPCPPDEEHGRSPDGNRIAFLCDGDLWSEAADQWEPATHVAELPRWGQYGTTDMMEHALGRHQAFWWSPDSRWIAVQRTDGPRRDWGSRVGDPIALVNLGIMAASGGPPIWATWDLARFPYLAKVIWTNHAPLTLVVVSGDQTELAVLRVDVPTGRTQVVLSERDPVWVNVVPNRLTWLDDGSGFLWMSEREGAWTLSLHSPYGRELREVVGAELGLRDVAGVTPGGDVIVTAAADPREQHVWRVPVAGGVPVALTWDGGVHAAVTKHGVVVVTSLLRDGGTKVTAIRDHVRHELPGTAERPTLVPTTTIEDVALCDHRQYVAITRPRAFDHRRRYPVLLNVVGDLAHKAVVDARDAYLLDQWIADAGFIVVRTDGRGTPDRGRAWSRAIADGVTARLVDDQLGALEAVIAAHPELDRSRVGVFGAGLGGYVAMMAVRLHPEVFAAASAISPIVDWASLPTALAGRAVKLPELSPEADWIPAMQADADRLSRPIFLLEGPSTPEAVAPAPPPLEPGEQHGHRHRRFMNAADTARASVEFFRRHLGVQWRPIED